MSRIALAAALAAIALGCRVAPPANGPVAPTASTRPSGRPSATADAKATPAPLATATPGARATATPKAPATGTASATVKLPTRLTPPLPSALLAVAGLIGPDGAGLIGPDGAGMVAAGSLNYELRQAAATTSISTMIRDQVRIYLETTQIIEGVLKAATVAALQPGATVTFADEENDRLTAEEKQKPENKLTLALLMFSDHARVEVFRGLEKAAEKQIAAISFESPTRGKALLRDLAPDKDGVRNWIAMTFDLERGQSSCDVYMQGRSGERTRARVAFASFPDAAAPAPTFTLRTAAFGKKPPAGGKPGEDGELVLAAKFRDEGAGAIVAVRGGAVAAIAPTGVIFLTPTGIPDPDNATPHAYFLDAGGKDLAPQAAPAALKGLVPKDEDASKLPAVPDPSGPEEGSPPDEPSFVFPE